MCIIVMVRQEPALVVSGCLVSSMMCIRERIKVPRFPLLSPNNRECKEVGEPWFGYEV